MSGPDVSSPRLLLVDEHPVFAENLRELLEGWGYAVAVANTCAGALELAKRGLDLALVDVKLPDGDGAALAAGIKEVNPDCQVIFLTGSATLESAVAAVRAGACAYLLKPCAPTELMLTLEQAMRQVRLYTERRELARRAQVAEKLAAVGTLTAGLSHEIRNPLNAAALQLSVLERRMRRLPEEMQPPLLEPLALVRDEILRLDHILDDFLQFARPIHFDPRPVDLLALCEKIRAFFEADAERQGVRLEADCRLAKPVAGDEGRLWQVLVNLTLNGLEATPAGGRVRLTCRPDGHEAMLSVEDSGPGIPPDLRDRIFEPFFTTKASGSGLGLAIVHSVVIQHGGRISTGAAPGGGAIFTVHLPFAT